MLVRENGVIKGALNEEQLIEWDRNDYTIPSFFVGVASGAFASTGTHAGILCKYIQYSRNSSGESVLMSAAHTTWLSSADQVRPPNARI
jgi:hypothetical protein